MTDAVSAAGARVILSLLALVVVPGAAIACALSCVAAAGPLARDESASAAHAHHDLAKRIGPAGVSVRAVPHDCGDHDAVFQAPTTLPRAAIVGDTVVLANESTPQRQLAGGLIVRSFRSTHGPPGCPGQVNPSVLRL